MSLQQLSFRSEIVRETPAPGEIDRLLAAIGLRTRGFRASDRPGHHIVVLESLADTIGISMDRIDYFQTLRDLRNKDIYAGSSHVSPSQATEAVGEALRLASETREWLMTQRPASAEV